MGVSLGATSNDSNNSENFEKIRNWRKLKLLISQKTIIISINIATGS